jgi:RNA polymerase sigma-70 factor (ECF subfamily)
LHAATLPSPVDAEGYPSRGSGMSARPVAARSADVATLFEATIDLGLRAAWRITRNDHDAEDVIQGVFLRLMKSPPQPWPDNPEGYVLRAATNAALDVLRRRKRQPPVDDPAALDMQGTLHDERDAASRLDEKRLAERLQQALVLLTPLEAEVFTLRFFEDRSNAEIAALLDKTPNHVGVTLHSARQKLKASLLDPTAARAASTDAGLASE